MKLKQRFSLIAALCGIELLILTSLTMVGADFVQRLQNFQFNEQECQYSLVDMVNFLNQTIYWSSDTAQANTVWKAKVVTANKKFHDLKDNSVTKICSAKFKEEIQNANNIWVKVLTLVNPFNGQIAALSEVQLTDDESRYISRYGIKAGAKHFTNSENVQSLLDRTLLMESNMKDLIRYSNELQEKMAEVNEMLKDIVAHWQILYRVMVFALGLVFVGLMFLSILSGTNKIIRGIKRLRDMSSLLSEKDFTTQITPQGSNEMQALMGNMNSMVNEINKFFIVVKKTAAKAISSGYSINDSSSSTAAATNEINLNIENITDEFEKINESLSRAVNAVNEINVQVKTLVNDNENQTTAIEESTAAVNAMAVAIETIRCNAIERSKAAEEMRQYVADGDEKIAATNKILAEVMGQLDKIREIVTIINTVSAQTNLLSMNAAIESAHAGEFGKVSNQSVEMIKSFSLITEDIEKINSRTDEITQKTDVTSATADKINEYCENLASNQETVALEIKSISELFDKAVDEIKEINIGTEEIVKRMDAVGTLSKESYKNMTDLENVLEEFKTTSDDSEEIQNEIDNNAIQNIISPELQAQLEADFNSGGDGDSDVEFDPDAVIKECEAVEEVAPSEGEKSEAGDVSQNKDETPSELIEEQLPKIDDMFGELN